MGTYLIVRFELFWQQIRHQFAPLKKFSVLLLLVAGHALLGLLAPLLLLGFQLFNPELSASERWPYLQMLLVMMFCWQGAVAWQQKTLAEQYFIESLSPNRTVSWIANTLMALSNHLPFWLLTLPVLLYVLLSGKPMFWFDALQLLLILLLLCTAFAARQSSWLALLAVFVLPVMQFWSLPLAALAVAERAAHYYFRQHSLVAKSLVSYWLSWFVRQQQNKALLLLMIFMLALWQYWLVQPLKAEAVSYVQSVFIWCFALLCYGQQKLWQQHLELQRYFWLAWCSDRQRLWLRLFNVLPVSLAFLLSSAWLDVKVAFAVTTLAVAMSFSVKFRLLSVALCSFILLVILTRSGGG